MITVEKYILQLFSIKLQLSKDLNKYKINDDEIYSQLEIMDFYSFRKREDQAIFLGD